MSAASYLVPIQQPLSRQTNAMSTSNSSKSNNSSSSAKKSKSLKDLLTSKDWMSEYQQSHVDVDLKSVFGAATSAKESGSSSQACALPVGNQSGGSVTKKPKTDWMTEYYASIGASATALKPLPVLTKELPTSSPSRGSSITRFRAGSMDKMSVDFSTFLTPSMDAGFIALHQPSSDNAGVFTSHDVATSLLLPPVVQAEEKCIPVETDNKLSDIAHSDNGLLSMIAALEERENANEVEPGTDNRLSDIANTDNGLLGIGMDVALPENEQSEEVEPETDNKLQVRDIPNSGNGLISMILALSEREKEQAEEEMLAKKVASQAKPRKKSRRTREPDVKQFVEPIDTDVLLGRGGRSNHHPGNVAYRNEVGNLREWYRSSEKNAKTDLSQLLVDWVQKEQKGRFLKHDAGTQQWYIVTNIVARRKASQALREHMTPEERDAKKKGNK